MLAANDEARLVTDYSNYAILVIRKIQVDFHFPIQAYLVFTES